MEHIITEEAGHPSVTVDAVGRGSGFFIEQGCSYSGAPVLVTLSRSQAEELMTTLDLMLSADEPEEG